jgi:hypothetical protein
VEPKIMRSPIADAGGILLGGPAALVTLIPEFIYSTRWASSRTYTFAVTDWGEAPDYKVDFFRHYRAGSIVEGGVKCDGPSGEWRIRAESKEGDNITKAEAILKLDEETLKGVHSNRIKARPM